MVNRIKKGDMREIRYNNHMNKNKGLKRYSDKKQTIEYRHSYNRDNYKVFYLTFHKIKDRKIIKELTNSPNKADTIREWYSKAK